MTTRQELFAVARRLAHVQPLTSLQEKIAPQHTAVLVVDMQNDWVAPGGILSKEGREPTAAQKMAQRLPAFIDAARSAGALVVFVRNVYSTEGNAYLSDSWLEQAARKRPGGYTAIPVCAPNSWEADYYGDVCPKDGDLVVTKHRYSAFYNTDLDTILRVHGIRTVVMTGVGTNVCVETTAREAFVRDYYVVIVRDATAAHTKEDHEATLKNIDRFFGEVSSIEDLCTIWQHADVASVGSEVVPA
jgi:ureidoacrylate peracid hydrolase